MRCAAPEPPGRRTAAWRALWAGRLSLCLLVLAGAPGLADSSEDARRVAEAERLSAEAAELHNCGRLLEAADRARRALAIREELLGPDHPATATSLSGLGEIAARLGDLELALRCHELALGIRLRHLGPQDPLTHLSRRQLADRYRERGRDDLAQGLYESVLRFQERELGSAHPATLDTREKLADLLLGAGELARARELLEETLRARRDHEVGPDLWTMATMARLGAALFYGGDLEGARETLERAVRGFEAALGTGHPATLAAMLDLATVVEAGGDLEAAIELHRLALEGEERILATVLAGTAESERAGFLDTFRATTNGAVALHARSAPDDPRPLELAFTTVLRRKARILDATLEDRLRMERAGGGQELFDEVRQLREEQADLLLRPSADLTTRQRLARYKELDDEIEALGRRLAEGSRQGDQSVPVTLDRVRSRLPPDAALIEFVRYRPFDARQPIPLARWGEPRYAVYLLRRDGPPCWADLGPTQPIDLAIHALREAIARRRPDVGRHGRILYDRTLGKLDPWLDGVSMLLLAPDETLHLAPFAALVDSGGAYLVERFTLQLLTSGRDLLRRAETPVSPEPPLLVGDPAFGPEVTGASHAAPLPPLPGTAREVRAVAKLLAVPATRVLLGPAATETAVKDARGPRVLHLATHGFFDAATPNPSEEIDERDPLPGQVWSFHRNDPLLRSGLALAGFNAWWEASSPDDGLLTALEVATLDLRGTEIAVLSACDTGVGQVRTGEGVFGLRRALVLAGVKTQVMTLWQVADDPTTDFIVSWYEQLLRGKGRSEALRQVQLASLRGEPLPVTRALPRGATPLEDTDGVGASRLAGTRHPFYWAGFILSGEGGPVASLVPKP